MCASFCCELSYAKFALDFAGKVCTHNEIAAFLAKCCDLANAKCVADFAAKLTKRVILIVAMYRLPEYVRDDIFFTYLETSKTYTVSISFLAL